MTTASSRFALAALLAHLALATTARADAAPPTEAQVEAARALYKEARELHRQGRLKDAIDKALEAYRTAATPVTALEAGTFLVEAGRLVEARDLLRAVAQMPVSPRESDKGREARQQASSVAASLDARIPKIAFADRPRGAEVLLDGKPFAAGDANAWVGVDPGPHTIVVRVGDKTCASITATLPEGEERTIDLHDAAKSCAPPAPTPPPPAPSPTTAPTTTAPPPPPPPAPHPRWLGVVLGAAGVAAIGGGGVIALVAKSDYDAASCPARGCSHDAYDARTSARSRADVATAVMIVGAAAAAGGAVVFFWPSERDASARTSVGVSTSGVRVSVPF